MCSDSLCTFYLNEGTWLDDHRVQIVLWTNFWTWLKSIIKKVNKCLASIHLTNFGSLTPWHIPNAYTIFSHSIFKQRSNNTHKNLFWEKKGSLFYSRCCWFLWKPNFAGSFIFWNSSYEFCYIWKWIFIRFWEHFFADSNIFWNQNLFGIINELVLETLSSLCVDLFIWLIQSTVHLILIRHIYESVMFMLWTNSKQIYSMWDRWMQFQYLNNNNNQKKKSSSRRQLNNKLITNRQQTKPSTIRT